MRTKQKGFINVLLLIIAVVAAGIVGYFALTKKTTQPEITEPTYDVGSKITGPTSNIGSLETEEDETADWKTYRSEEYGFEVKYPNDWNHASDVMSEIFSKRFIKNSNEFRCRINIATVQTDKFDNYITSFHPDRKQTKITINNIPAIKISSLPSAQAQGMYGEYAIKRTDEKKFSLDITEVIEKFIINKDGYKVAYGTVDDQDCIDIFDQILSTFKFIDN